LFFGERLEMEFQVGDFIFFQGDFFWLQGSDFAGFLALATRLLEGATSL
jgi:hypothetical protein